MNELDEHLANVMGENNGDNETEIEPTDPKYFEYTFDEENETAIIIGGNPDYCVMEDYYTAQLGSGKSIKYIQDGENKIIEIVIPSTVVEDGVTYTITSIGSAFARSEFTSITIPDSVTSIGNYAFFECINLASVTIPNSVTSIEGYAFSGCSSLTSITIPDSVTSIGNSAFLGCSGLTSVTIPNSVTSIGNHAFYYCSGLTSVTIGNGVTSIGSYTFRECINLASVTIPNSVTSIGNRAFSYCSGLTSVTIGNGVTSIGSYAFRECSSLTSITIDSETIVSSIADQYSPDDSYLVEFATTIYIKDTIPESSIGSYITENYTKAETDKTGYIKYTKNS